MGSFHFTALNPNRNRHSLKLVVEASFSSKAKLVERREHYRPLLYSWPYRGHTEEPGLMFMITDDEKEEDQTLEWDICASDMNTALGRIPSGICVSCATKSVRVFEMKYERESPFLMTKGLDLRYTHTQKEGMPKLGPVLSHLTGKAAFFSENINTEMGTICLLLTTLLIK